ncbi:uncharacterized protein LOC109365342, partial [Meleagris gallopavo]|uniref:uncharacterized protein LOC109365342 n=1 Tax=Meleagris gallopavo TaxID=9103 RepID=UPI00093B6DCA
MPLPHARKSRRICLSFSPPFASSASQSGETGGEVVEVRPPRRPKLAWQAWTPEEEEEEEMEKKEIINPRFEILEHWRRAAIACICEFLRRKDKDEQQKIRFLRGICTLCKCKDTSLNLDAFCRENRLAANVQVLIDEEPKHTLGSEIKQEAMKSFANMSTVETALEGQTESILNSCFNSVFFLPPELCIPEKEKRLYLETMSAMDSMLEALVQNCPNSRMREELHSIFQALLHFFSSQQMHVRTRALHGVLMMITSFMEKVRSQAPSSQAVSHSPYPRAAQG